MLKFTIIYIFKFIKVHATKNKLKWERFQKKKRIIVKMHHLLPYQTIHLIKPPINQIIILFRPSTPRQTTALATPHHIPTMHATIIPFKR